MQQENLRKFESPKEDSNQKYIIVATLSFIVGFGLAWLIVSNKMENTSTTTSTPTEDENEEAVIVENSDIKSSEVSAIDNTLVVADQPEGVEVAVEKVVLSKTSWVVIHEKDQTGQLSRILGAQLFDAGVWSGKVELLRGTLAGTQYVAAVHPDNGDRAFDPKKDIQEISSGGVPVQTVFTVSPVME